MGRDAKPVEEAPRSVERRKSVGAGNFKVGTSVVAPSNFIQNLPTASCALARRCISNRRYDNERPSTLSPRTRSSRTVP
jgi:hypothetical protein